MERAYHVGENLTSDISDQSVRFSGSRRSNTLHLDYYADKYYLWFIRPQRPFALLKQILSIASRCSIQFSRVTLAMNFYQYGKLTSGISDHRVLLPC